MPLPLPPPQHQGALHWVQAAVPSKKVRLAETSPGTENPSAYRFLRWKPCSRHGGSAFFYAVTRNMDSGYHQGGHTLAFHLSKERLASCGFDESRFVFCLLFSLKQGPGAGRWGYVVPQQGTSRGGAAHVVAMMKAKH